MVRFITELLLQVQLLDNNYCTLDEQVRSFEVDGLVTKYEGWEFLGIVKDEDNLARGIVAQNMTTSEIKSFGSDAVIMATGGPGIIFGKTTNSMINTG